MWQVVHASGELMGAGGLVSQELVTTSNARTAWWSQPAEVAGAVTIGGGDISTVRTALVVETQSPSVLAHAEVWAKEAQRG